MVNASFFEVDYALAMVARASLLIAKSSGSVGWSCPETARSMLDYYYYCRWYCTTTWTDCCHAYS